MVKDNVTGTWYFGVGIINNNLGTIYSNAALQGKGIIFPAQLGNVISQHCSMVE